MANSKRAPAARRRHLRDQRVARARGASGGSGPLPARRPSRRDGPPQSATGESRGPEGLPAGAAHFRRGRHLGVRLQEPPVSPGGRRGLNPAEPCCPPSPCPRAPAGTGRPSPAATRAPCSAASRPTPSTEGKAGGRGLRPHLGETVVHTSVRMHTHAHTQTHAFVSSERPRLAPGLACCWAVASPTSRISSTRASL